MELQSKALDKAQDILQEEGLDYEIQKLPLQTEGGIVSPYYGLFNPANEKFLNSVTDQYHVTQNRDILAAIIQGTQKFTDQLEVSKVRDIHEGRKLMVELKVRGDEAFGNDRVERTITFFDSNDGSTSLSMMIGFHVYSCSNGLFIETAEDEKASKIKKKHTRSIEDVIPAIPNKVETLLNASMSMKEKFKQYEATEASRELVHDLAERLVGVSKKASDKELEGVSTRKLNQMEELYRNTEMELNAKGDNLWGLLNGVTRWTTHSKSAPQRENGRIESLAIGTNANTNEEALKFVEELATS